MEELIQEHQFARETVERIEAAKESYLLGERNAPSDIILSVNLIIEFYPHHIDKEDRHFFYRPWVISRTRKSEGCWTSSRTSTAG